MLEFLAERAKQSKWIRKPTRMLKLVPLEKEAETIEEACEKELEGIVEDTEKNTQLVLKVNKDFYPVRDCAIHTILKRAGINGTGLKKLEKATYAKVVNYCLQVAKGDALIKVADGKVSAVHGGDDHDYCVLDMQTKTNLQWGDDFQMVECSGADAAAQIVKNIYLKEIQMYGMEQVQILSPYKVRSAAGVLELNRSLQDEVNPPVSGKRELHLGGEIFREGDRILQNKNTEFASNGDLGTLVQIAEDEDNNPLVQIVFTDGRRVKYEAEQVEMIEHANAITIHKSQGSECQVVIIPWLKAFYPMLKRNIFYTGITRAKQRVYIVGEWKAVCQAIHTDDTGTRKTMLAVKIQQYCERYQPQSNRQIPTTICNRAV